jgi:CubicO group peptidase (beta-lactamase class C family)
MMIALIKCTAFYILIKKSVTMKKFLRRSIWLIILAIIVFAVVYAWPRAPILTAFAARGMCSGVFVMEREPERVSEEDLSFFPISLARTKIDFEEKTVTARVLGLAKRKAVHREGLGAVLVHDIPEADLKARTFLRPDPGYSPDTIPWPKGELLSDSLPPGLDYDRLNTILENAFDKEGTEPLKKTLGVAIVYEDALVAEKYLEPYDGCTPFHGWSQAKSITNAMIGIMARDGKINVEEPPGIPEWKDDGRREITIHNLLQMTDGLHFVENYFDISEVTRMLYTSDDMYRFAIGNPLEHTPGSVWNYSGGTTNILSGIIRNAFDNDEEYHAFPYRELFYPIGMLNTLFETDGAGTYVGSSYCYASTRDWARFGLLYMNDGIFAGDTILPEGWVDYSTDPAPGSQGQYGAQIWLQKKDGKYPEIPEDMFLIDGFQGQRVFVIPSKKLVVVRMGYSMKNFDMNQFLMDILSTLPE